MKRNFTLFLLGLTFIIAGSGNLISQETGHYVPGLMGIKAGTLPPPGDYYIMHNIFYSANKYYDGDGNDANMDFDLTVFVNAHRYVHVWEDVLFGANYAVNVIVPLQYTDISIGVFNLTGNNFGVGDVIIDPMVLAWNKKKYDLSIGIGAVAPIGRTDSLDPAVPGKGFWTGMLTFGGTYYFDEHKTWTASILARYEVHSKKKDFDITAGNDFTFEYGIGKTIPGKTIWTFGVSGYAHWQITEDNGDDVWYDASVKDKVFATGPEVQCFIPSIKLNLELRGQLEYGAIDRSQGTKACLSIIKAF